MKTKIQTSKLQLEMCRKLSSMIAQLAGNGLGLIVVSMFVVGPAWGAKPQSYKAPPSAPAVAASCVGCHGESGISSNSLWPNLAGQKRDYLAKQLKSFRDHDRTDPMMNSIVQSLSDADIDSLAAYYSALKP